MMRRRDVMYAALLFAGAAAGCSDGQDDGSDGGATTAQPPLAIDTIEFAVDEPRGYQQYEPRDDATYELGETVWLYAEPSGVTVEAADGGYTFEIVIEVTVTLPDGTERDIGSRTYGQPLDDPAEIEELYLKPSVSVSDPAEPGEYEATVTVSDELDGETATTSVSFDVEAG